MEEFDALNEKVIKAEANDEEIQRFDELALLYAREEVELFESFDEYDQEKILEEEWNQLGNQYKEEINSA